MQQFFVEDEQVNGKVVISGGDVNHIRNVLRMKKGEKIRVSTPAGVSYFCHIDTVGEDEVTAVIDAQDAIGTELPCRIVLFQGLPKGDKMELIIQKSVELGVAEIVPVAMKNCVMKLDEKRAQNKGKRWQAIAESAAKQSKRTFVPEVLPPVSFQKALEMAQELDIMLLPYENARGMQATREVIRSIRPGMTVGIMIGPEGGFSPEEIEQAAIAANLHKITLGRRILRTETAGFTALSMLIYELDD